MKSETSQLTMLIVILMALLGFTILGKMIQTKVNELAIQIESVR